MLPSRFFFLSKSSLLRFLPPMTFVLDGAAWRAEDRLAYAEGFMSDMWRSFVLIHWVLAVEVDATGGGSACDVEADGSGRV